MVSRLRHNGFSLVEVMISAGILAVGFVLIAGAFSVGTKLTAIATERTIGLAAAEEAFAKIRLYGVDPSDGWLPSYQLYSDWNQGIDSVKYSLVANAGINLDDDQTPADPTDSPELVPVWSDADAFDEYNYPSTHLVDKKKYRWSALCRDLSGDQFQVTVFVCRIPGLGVKYPEVDRYGVLSGGTTEIPAAIKIERDTGGSSGSNDNLIDISAISMAKYVMEGSTLVDDQTGTLMYVVGREYGQITLLDNVDETQLGDYFWVIPPSVKPADLSVDGRYPCVEVYQRIITF